MEPSENRWKAAERDALSCWRVKVLGHPVRSGRLIWSSKGKNCYSWRPETVYQDAGRYESVLWDIKHRFNSLNEDQVVMVDSVLLLIDDWRKHAPQSSNTIIWQRLIFDSVWFQLYSMVCLNLCVLFLFARLQEPMEPSLFDDGVVASSAIVDTWRWSKVAV